MKKAAPEGGCGVRRGTHAYEIMMIAIVVEGAPKFVTAPVCRRHPPLGNANHTNLWITLPLGPANPRGALWMALWVVVWIDLCKRTGNSQDCYLASSHQAAYWGN